MTIDRSNINALAASLMVEELVRQGVTFFVLSPGSRSTPLTVAVARHPKTTDVMHYDERGAAFFALGHARATEQPVALVCTSGTATANYYPAVIEASQEQIPLILLTADRPPELRECGANQTIDQVGLYGKYVRWGIDLECPNTDVPVTHWLETIDNAVGFARSNPPGPVHVNCQYREPLAPLADGSDLSDYMSEVRDWVESEESYASHQPMSLPVEAGELVGVADALNTAQNGLLIIGGLRSRRDRDIAQKIADRLQWPVFADIRSGLRQDQIETLQPYADLLLQTQIYENWRPDCVLHLGGRLTSRRLLEWLNTQAPDQYIQIDDHYYPVDPIRKLTRRLRVNIAEAGEELLQQIAASNNVPVTDDLRTACEKTIDTVLAEAEHKSEAAIARVISRYLPRSHGLWLASSMPIRLIDMYAVPTIGHEVGSNRGASGIDGTVASAAGYATGLGKPVTLVIGDLALLHDLNSLALLASTALPLTIVVINNDGGGIFDFLPVSQVTDVYEPYFVTPHGYSFRHAAEMFDLVYAEPEDMTSFEQTYQMAANDNRTWLIEVKVRREESMRTHDRIRAALLDNIKAEVSG